MSFRSSDLYGSYQIVKGNMSRIKNWMGHSVKSGVLTAVEVSMIVSELWRRVVLVVTNVLEKHIVPYLHPEGGRETFLWNVGDHLQDRTMSRPRRPPLTAHSSLLWVAYCIQDVPKLCVIFGWGASGRQHESKRSYQHRSKNDFVKRYRCNLGVWSGLLDTFLSTSVN